jgi:hypothetical protein
MDLRTTLHELDEVSQPARSGREAALLDVLPECRLRRSKHGQVCTMRAHVRRLRGLRKTIQTRRRFH